MTEIKKLIEVALPLEKINAESAREKSIRHGHPSTLHLWWARRPLAAARAVIWSSLVDDPSSHPEEFPTEAAQNAERQRLFAILEQLVVWENSNNETVLNAAKAEIMKSTHGNPPPLLDPFAGGGAIPLEAQRLGLEAHASDLNPVAVMINKAMIEIPPKFANQPPVNPEARAKFGSKTEWKGAAGLAEDVRYYGEWMKKEAFKQIGNLYPTIKNKSGGEKTVVTWIWARTVKCPNPACGCEVPLVKSFYLTQRKGKEVWAKPYIEDGKTKFSIEEGTLHVPDGTVDQKINGAKCFHCGAPISFDQLRKDASSQKMSTILMAMAIEDGKQRKYISNYSDIGLNTISKPENYPTSELPKAALGFRIQQYGMTDFSELYTSRQLNMLTCFSGLVASAMEKIFVQGKTIGLSVDVSKKYAKAVSLYLAFVVDRMANYGSSQCLWDTRGGTIVQTFGRQALSFIWNFAEANPFSNANLVGNWSNAVNVISSAIEFLPDKTNYPGEVKQKNAMEPRLQRKMLVSTDPPYYDNIGYADLSDFFYLWLRQSLKDIYPEDFTTIQVPKMEELIANPFRHESPEEANSFFEKGMLKTFKNIYSISNKDFPVTVYYAFKQSESENENISSTGWETILTAIIDSGFVITGTWPMRTENPGGLRVNNRNALASSIILVCRKRPEDATVCTRRSFINELKRDLKPALQKLQASSIAPVDLAQSAIGPGIGVYSRFSKVLEADGSPMSVRSALQIINQELDIYFNEQDGELDRDSRFCVDLYTQNAFNEIKFGDADTLARAKNTSVEKLSGLGVLSAQKGVVRLLGRDELSTKVNANEQLIWLLTEQLTHAMETGGVQACAEIIAPMYGANADQAKDLAYRLFTIADRKGWTQEAYAYNSLVIAWRDIQARAADIQAVTPKQDTLFQV